MQTATKPCGMAKVRENMKQKLDAVDPFKLRHVPCSIFIFILSLEFLVCFVNLYRHHVILCKQDKLKGSDGLACYALVSCHSFMALWGAFYFFFQIVMAFD